MQAAQHAQYTPAYAAPQYSTAMTTPQQYMQPPDQMQGPMAYILQQQQLQQQQQQHQQYAAAMAMQANAYAQQYAQAPQVQGYPAPQAPPQALPQLQQLQPVSQAQMGYEQQAVWTAPDASTQAQQSWGSMQWPGFVPQLPQQQYANPLPQLFPPQPLFMPPQQTAAHPTPQQQAAQILNSMELHNMADTLNVSSGAATLAAAAATAAAAARRKALPAWMRQDIERAQAAAQRASSSHQA